MLVNNMNKLKTICLATTFMAVPSLAFAQSELIIKDFVGTINWTQSDEAIRVDILRGANELNIDESGGNVVTLAGEYRKLTRIQCKGSKDKRKLSVTIKKDYKTLDEYPALNISVPKDTRVILKNSVPFIYGRPDVNEFKASPKGCGQIEVGNVTTFLNAHLSGSSDFSSNNIGKGQIKLSGSSDMTIGDAGDLYIDLSGSSELIAGDAQKLEADLSGSSDVRIANVGGSADMKLSGATNADIGVVLGGLSFKGSGSSDANLQSVTGPISVNVSGASEVNIKDGQASKTKFSASGASDIKFDGRANDAEIKASGASDIIITEVSGTLKQSRSGSAGIKIKKYVDVTRLD